MTNQVLDFKISMHPADEAVAYLVRSEGADAGVVYALMDSPTYGVNSCPKSFKIKVLDGLTGDVNDKYKIVSNLDDFKLGTTATMLTINRNGDLVGWRGRNQIFRNAARVYFGDLVMNTCYGTSNKSFSSYVAFAMEKGSGTYHRVLKIKGRNTVAESKWDTRTWKSIQDFKAANNVCSSGSDVYPPPPPAPRYLSKTIKCESWGFKFAVCDAQIGTGFVTSVQLIHEDTLIRWCKPNDTFGSDSRSMWVAGGCRGTFKVNYLQSYYP